MSGLKDVEVIEGHAVPYLSEKPGIPKQCSRASSSFQFAATAIAWKQYPPSKCLQNGGSSAILNCNDICI